MHPGRSTGDATDDGIHTAHMTQPPDQPPASVPPPPPPPPYVPGSQTPPPWAPPHPQQPMFYYGRRPPPPRYMPGMPGQPPVMPAKKGMPAWLLISLILAGVLVVGGACGLMAVLGGGRSGTPGTGSGSASGDVTVSECTNNRFSGPYATLTVTNSTSSTKDYIIKVEFLDGSTRLGTRTVNVNDLGPGMTEHPTATAFRQTSATGFTCQVTKVTRF